MSKPQIKFEFLETFTELETNEFGLASNEALFRLKKFGPNTIQKINTTPTIIKLLKQFTSLMILILLAATILAFATGETIDALIIFTVIIINGLIGFFQENKAEKAIEALKKIVAPTAKLFRDGKLTAIEAIKIVPGDIILLEEGSVIPADGIIVESTDFKTNESILTGESTPVTKQNFNLNIHSTSPTQKTNTVFMGTSVSHGNAKFVVTATGIQTEFGKIANLTQTTKKETSPLQKEINQLSKLCAFFALGFTSLIFLWNYFFNKITLIENLIFSISIAVAAVPEGLPATITISLALAVQKLVKKKAIVKQLSSAETLGSTTIICTDKTGTLTKNEMTVTNIYCDNILAILNENHLKFYDHRKELTDKDLINNPFNQSFETLLKCFNLCNNSTFDSKNNTYLGDPTESALLGFSNSINKQSDQIQNDFTRLQEFSFDSNRKKMSVIVQHKKTGKIYVFSKGAPNEILKQSDQILQKNRPTVLTEQNRSNLLTINDQFSTNALRCLAFSYKEITGHYKSNQNPPTQKQVEQNHTFIGLCGMIDPPRENIKKALQITKTAGIRTIILTGDHGQTAKAIAKQIEFFKSESELTLISGEELDKLSNPELSNILKNPTQKLIFYRINPEHKLKIVELLKSNNEIVAVTGDGVNDAPALKRADIGIAMGITGTDVTRETANMVLADDSFYTIVNAIKEGRIIYENIRKFVSYMFTTNLGEIICIFFSILLNLPLPLTAVLILIINLATDLFPALALNLEPPEPNILSQKPRNPNSRISDRDFITRTVYLGTIIGFLSISIFLFILTKEGWTYGQEITIQPYQKAISACFATLVFLQLFNSINCKSSTNSILNRSILNNKHLNLAIIFSALIPITLIQIPFLNQIFNTQPLTLTEWTIITLTSLSIIPLEEIRKKLKSKKLNQKTIPS